MSEEPLRVDMLAAARDAQWSPEGFLGPGAVRAVAPAKVNLALEVGGLRDDGYHQVATVMHGLALHDVLHLHRAPADESEVARRAEQAAGTATVAVGGPAANLAVSIDVADKASTPYPQPVRLDAADNLAFKAIDALARAVGHDAFESISLRVEKAIPFEAGLAGGSSDAAAALLAAARWWGLGADDPAVAETAASLGADVTFFLHGGCALLDGRGDRFVRSLAPMKGPLVLVKPPAGVSTPKAYAAFDEAPVAVPPSVVESMARASEASQVPLFNSLEAAARSIAPELAEVAEWLSAQEGVASAEDVLLCGSGAATFARTGSFSEACAIAAAAQARGWWSRATTFSSLGAAVL